MLHIQEKFRGKISEKLVDWLYINPLVPEAFLK